MNMKNIANSLGIEMSELENWVLRKIPVPEQYAPELARLFNGSVIGDKVSIPGIKPIHIARKKQAQEKKQREIGQESERTAD